MGTYRNGIMGPFNGKVGTVVGYMWNGKCCMRAYNRHVANPRTDKQMEHRALFKQEVQLAAKMRHVVVRTMTDQAREEGLTSYNLFVKVNQPAFGVEQTPQSLRDSSPKTGEQLIDSRLVVDYSALVLSMGDVPQTGAATMEWTADNVLNVSFDRGLGKGTDEVRLYVYDPALGEGFLSAPVYRRDKRLALSLPDTYAGHEVHVYLMVQAEDGRWSDSQYVGEIALNELVQGVGDEEDGACDEHEVGGVGGSTGGGDGLMDALIAGTLDAKLTGGGHEVGHG